MGAVQHYDYFQALEINSWEITRKISDNRNNSIYTNSLWLYIIEELHSIKH